MKFTLRRVTEKDGTRIERELTIESAPDEDCVIDPLILDRFEPQPPPPPSAPAPAN